MPKKGEKLSPGQSARMREVAAIKRAARTHKVCPICMLNLTLDNFTLRADGVTPYSYCKDCYDGNDALKARRKVANRGAVLRRIHVEMTPERYDEMLAEQGGGCAICGCKDPDDGRVNLPLDHNHKTGAVRGILCPGCNKGLGHFYDNPERLEAAAAYLRRHGEGSSEALSN